MPVPIVTEDGVTVYKGDRVYNYYDMEPGVVVSEPETDGGFAGWFDFRSDSRSGLTLLNGQRICSMAYARRRGFRNADQ